MEPYDNGAPFHSNNNGVNMKLEEIIQANFTVFGRMNEENRVKHIDTVKYIRNLSNSVGINISTWNLFEVFGGSAGGNTLHTDKAQINKIFWERFKAGDSTPPPEPVDKASITANIEDWMEKSGRQFTSNFVQRAARDKDNALSSANDYHREYARHLAKAAAIDMEIRNFTNNPPDVGGEIGKVIDAGFFKFESLVDGVITFTTGEIINTDRRPSAGVDISVNLGKYKVQYSLADATSRDGDRRRYALKVIQFENNKFVGRYYHPHINNHGDICWGNAIDTANKAIVEHKISGAMTLLAAILTTYNPSDPYVSLHDFVDAHKFEECGNCGERQFNVNESHCHNCGWNGTSDDDEDEEESNNEEW